MALTGGFAQSRTKNVRREQRILVFLRFPDALSANCFVAIRVCVLACRILHQRGALGRRLRRWENPDCRGLLLQYSSTKLSITSTALAPTRTEHIASAWTLQAWARPASCHHQAASAASNRSSCTTPAAVQPSTTCCADCISHSRIAGNGLACVAGQRLMASPPQQPRPLPLQAPPVAVRSVLCRP